MSIYKFITWETKKEDEKFFKEKYNEMIRAVSEKDLLKMLEIAYESGISYEREINAGEEM